jgi:alpha-tubulin suppressor-like RCC1 family protein
VAVLGEDAFAVGSGGSVSAWGGNLHGQLGNGTTVNRYSPAPVPGLTGITQVSAGPGYTLAVRSDGTVLHWASGTWATARPPAPLSRRSRCRA